MEWSFMKKSIAISLTGLALGALLSFVPVTQAKGDDFGDVGKLIEQFYHVKHQGPVAGRFGVSVYGSAKRLAEQSGGEAVKVKRTKDYAAGLSKIIGNLTARYSLGFTLAEGEKDDGRLHNLEVKVKAADAKGKTRKLEVSSRRGYY